MDYIAQLKDYWIAPNAIHISLNALGDANRIQCSVASGAVIMCYIYGTANDGLGYDNGHQYRTWPIVIAPTYFNTNTQKYVYVAIPKNQTVATTAMVVFPSEQLDIYGKNGSNEQIGSTDYFFIWLQGIISEVQESNNTLERQWTQNIDYGLLDTDQARDAKVDDTTWYSYSHLTDTVTFLKEIVMNVGSSFRNLFLGPNGGKELTSVATDDTTPDDSATAVATPAYLRRKYLRKDVDDTANGQITFNKGIIVHEESQMNGITNDGDIVNTGDLTQYGEVVVGDPEDQTHSTSPVVRSSNFVSGMSGWFIDHLGNGEFESLTVRSFLEVTELLINRLQAQEGDTIFTDNDQIESIEEGEETDHSKYYILTLKEKWQGYFTSQQYGNIIKGIINTLAANYEGVSDVDPDECVEVDGNNKYYTSWMRVVADRNTDPTLGTNQIKVVLYGDNEVPAQKNFPPCKLMTIGRWGCIDYADPDDSATLASIEKRQRLFYISVSDGRIMKLRGVNSPILSSWNYGTTLGTLPEFVYNWHEVSERALPTRDYLYAQGIIVQSIIEVYPDGQPKGKFIDRGEWQDNTEYLCYEFNPTSGDWETHDVWHNTCKWRCLQHQPVTSGGVSTYYEPKWNSPYWKLIEGNENLSIEFVSSNGTSFRVGFVDTVITPYLFYGSVDISSDIATASWSWTRETESGKTDADRSWDANHVGVRVLHLTNADMPIAWSRSNRAIFTATVVINDGRTDRIIQNQVIA